jgi:ribosome biogenesis GTPase
LSRISQGLVVAAFGRQYLAELDDGSQISCLTRGKKSEAACGDVVELRHTANASSDCSARAQAVIERVMPRRSLLYRSDAFREKVIAANVTQMVIVVAPEPAFSDELVARCLVAAVNQRLEALIVLNKCDLASVAHARKRLSTYSRIGYRVLEISARQDVSALRPLLHGHSSVLIGQSGMGKSTLINAIVPDAQAATREISMALDSGKHTTTHAKLYRLDHNSVLIDCPGVQAFGLHHLSFGEIERGFVEFGPYVGQCRFHNCRHAHEPGCALVKAVADGKIDARRLQLFQQITGR